MRYHDEDEQDFEEMQMSECRLLEYIPPTLILKTIGSVIKHQLHEQEAMSPTLLLMILSSRYAQRILELVAIRSSQFRPTRPI